MQNSFAAAENGAQPVLSALHVQRNTEDTVQKLKLPKIFACKTATAACKSTSSQVFVAIMQLTDGKLTSGKCHEPFPS